MPANIYRIDDVLIRAGYAVGLFAAVAAFSGPLGDVLDRSPLGVAALPFLVAAPIVMLIAGYVLRRREQHLVEIWRLLQEHGEMPVEDLRHMTGYSRAELRKAVSLLNRKIAAGLSFDAGSDTIRHVRLGPRERITHSQRCGSCGAAVSVDVSATSQAHDLNCPYCQGALDGQSISALQNELLMREARQRRPDPAPAPVFISAPAPAPAKKRFSVVLFVILMMMFWPAALVYAINRANNSLFFR